MITAAQPPPDLFAGMMNEDAARAILSLRASPEVQEWAEAVSRKSSEGMLVDEEKRQFESYADMVDMISLLQAHARRVLRHAGQM